MEVKLSKFSEAFKKFSDWVESIENQLNSACHCCPQDKRQTTQHVINYHQGLQKEVEDLGKKLNCDLKRHLSEDGTIDTTLKNESSRLEEKWHKLWLKSLEQLVVVESTRRCPKHNSTLIGKPSQSPSNKSLVRPTRNRPISYPNHNGRLEWDYKYTLSLQGCHKENGSQIDLDSVDEQVTKNLTEFGENYEFWLGKEDEIACIPVHSRPQSVEPTERPEPVKAIITNPNSHKDINCNILMVTTPSSIISVDAREAHKFGTKIGIMFIVGIIVLIFSLIHEPHYMHKSYHFSQPPV